MVTDANEMTDRTSPTDPFDFKASSITVSVTSTGNCADTLHAPLDTDGDGFICIQLYIKI